MKAQRSVTISTQQFGSLTASTVLDVSNTNVCMTKINLVAYSSSIWQTSSSNVTSTQSLTASVQIVQVGLS